VSGVLPASVIPTVLVAKEIGDAMYQDVSQRITIGNDNREI
jgi:hypothetical protein